MICTYVYSLSVFYSGGRVVHSYGRIIPFDFPITNLQQISGTDGIGRINCTVSSGTPMFNVINAVQTDDVTLTSKETTATLVVNTTNTASFTNRDVTCSGSNYFYLFLSPSSKCTTQCKHYSWGRNMTYSISNIYSLYVSLHLKHSHKKSAKQDVQ